jgi:hypothetical protein
MAREGQRPVGDADSGLATYGVYCNSCPDSIYVTRLSDGKTMLLARVDFIEGLELEPAGLVYATSSKLVRYSLEQLRAALG